MIKKIFTVAALLSATLIGQTLSAAAPADVSTTLMTEFMDQQQARYRETIATGTKQLLFNQAENVLFTGVTPDHLVQINTGGFASACISRLALNQVAFVAWLGQDGHLAVQGREADRPPMEKFIKLHSFMKPFFEKAVVARHTFMATYHMMLSPRTDGLSLVDTDPISQLYNALIRQHGDVILRTNGGQEMTFRAFILARVALLHASITAPAAAPRAESKARKALRWIGYAAATGMTCHAGADMVTTICMDPGATPLTTLALIPLCTATLAGLAWLSYQTIVQAPTKLGLDV